MKDKLKTLLKIIISVGLIVYLFTYKVDKTDLVANFRLLDWRYVPVVFLIIVVHYVVSSFRWKSLLIHHKSNEVSRFYLFKLYFIGAFFNNFMPTSIGGDVYKVYRLGKKINDPITSFSSVFTERFTGILMLVFIGLFSMSRHLGWGVLILVLWIICGFYLGMNVLRLISMKIKFFKKLYDALMVYQDHLGVLMFAMFTSLIIQFLSIMTQYMIFLAVGIKLPILYCLMVFPIITLAGFFIPSINGIGVQDALYVSMFSFVGVTASAAISVSIIYHMIRMSVSLIGGIFYALEKNS